MDKLWRTIFHIYTKVVSSRINNKQKTVNLIHANGKRRVKTKCGKEKKKQKYINCRQPSDNEDDDDNKNYSSIIYFGCSMSVSYFDESFMLSRE